MRRRILCLQITLLLCISAAPILADDDGSGGRFGNSAGGRLSWVADGELDLVGDLWTDLPFRVDERNAAYVSIFTRTTLDQPDDFTFRVRDLQYDLEAGWRGRQRWLGNGKLSAFAGQRGKQFVDTDGQPYVRYLGVGLESREYRDHRWAPSCATRERSDRSRPRCSWARRFDWFVSGGPVVKEREVEADGVVQGAFRFWITNWLGGRSAFGFDVELDGLVDGTDLDADLALGPRISFSAEDGRRASFFVTYQTGKNPLGFGKPLWLVGFSYDEGANAPAPGLAGPEIDGWASLGGGEGRIAGQLKLRFLSPEFAGGTRAVAVIDANVLTADDTGDLYYFYYLGIEHRRRGLIYGGYFYHRSNHQLAEQNAIVTSINVLEGGMETDHWQRPARRAAGRRWGLVDGLARVGYLLSSSFGEDPRWHLRGGVRWSLPGRGSFPIPYLRFEGEAGDVERTIWAAGVVPLENLELQLEYRDDEQYFSADSTAFLVAARYYF